MDLDEWVAVGRANGWLDPDWVSSGARRPSGYVRTMARSVRDSETGCLVFTYGSKRNGKYGRMRNNGVETTAHRVVWEHHHGPVPDGMYIRHKCDNPPCVEIEHLEIGTPLDNSRDRVERGRAPSGERHLSAKLTWEIVDEVRASPESNRALARRYGVSPAAIGAVRRGVTWKGPRQ